MELECPLLQFTHVRFLFAISRNELHILDHNELDVITNCKRDWEWIPGTTRKLWKAIPCHQVDTGLLNNKYVIIDNILV